MHNEQHSLIRYVILAIVAFVIIQYLWQWILGGFALMGLYYVFVEIGRQGRR